MTTRTIVRRLQSPTIAFAAICAAYCLYAVLFIYRTSFVIDGQRYFSLFDDAMISMRYARNLVQGYGLVWNPGGEPVEGYTNLLWVLYMAAVHLLPVPPSMTSLLVQVTGALLLLANLYVVKRIAELLSDGSKLMPLAAVTLTALYLPLNTWGLQGTEVSVLALLLSISAYTAMAQLQSGRYRLALYLVLGLGTLVRPDFAVLFVAVLLFMACADRSYSARHLRHGLTILALCIGGQTLFRLVYYGELLPNTYYLKMTGFPPLLRMTRGLWVTATFVSKLNPLLFLLPFALLLRGRDRLLLLPFTLLLAQLGYSVYVGGDAWEGWGGSNRYVSVVMPLYFVLLAAAIWRLTKAVTYRFLTYGRVALVVVSLVSVNASIGPQPLREWLLLTRSLDVQGNAKYVEIGLALRHVTADTATVAVVWAGATPYFSDRYSIDLLGKNDRWVARGEARPEIFAGQNPLIAFFPGHSKWDLRYSIGEQRPDVVVGWEGVIREPMLHVPEEYVVMQTMRPPLYLLRGSMKILWDRVAIAP